MLDRRCLILVELITRTTDLQNAIHQLAVNRGRYAETDFADILVSGFSATLRSVGTEAEIPVNGIHPGSARVPFPVLQNLANALGTFKREKMTILCTPGVIRVGTYAIKDANIELGKIPDRRISIPIDLSLLEILGLARALTPQQIVEQGLSQRIQDARQNCSQAVAGALSVLEKFGIDERQIVALIEKQVAEAAERMRPSIAMAER